MIDKTEVFTFTLLYRDEDEQVVLIKKGETPAKSEDEADSVLSSTNDDEKEAVAKIIDKMFSSAEPGSEDSVTNSLEDFENKYDISLEELEEEVGEDLDNDSEKDESDTHEDSVLDSDKDPEEVTGVEEYPAFAIISIDTMTDPTDNIIPRHKSRFTQPFDFNDEELVEEDNNTYDPVFAVNGHDEEELEEAAAPQQAISSFISTARGTKRPLNIASVTQIFNTLSITDPDAKLKILQMALQTGNVKLFQLAGQNAIQGRMEIVGEPELVINGVQPTAGAQEVNPSDATAVNQALSKFAGLSQ